MGRAKNERQFSKGAALGVVPNLDHALLAIEIVVSAILIVVVPFDSDSNVLPCVISSSYLCFSPPPHLQSCLLVDCHLSNKVLLEDLIGYCYFYYLHLFVPEDLIWEGGGGTKTTPIEWSSNSNRINITMLNYHFHTLRTKRDSFS